MMLSTFWYGLEEETQKELFDALKKVSLTTGAPFRIELITNSISESMAAVRSTQEMALWVLGIAPLSQDPQRLSIRLGRLAMQTNRDHYVVYILSNPSELEKVLPLCARCAGIVVCPPKEKDLLLTFTPLFEDYHHLYQGKTAQEGPWISLKSDGKLYRVRLEDISMVQAMNKTVEFRTAQRIFSVYATMETIGEMLGDTFIRCHRSYFVNRDKIQYVDFRQMVIYLVDGSQVLLSRSYKESIASSFALPNKSHG